MIKSRQVLIYASAAMALAAGLFMNGTLHLADGAFVSEAQARVGDR